MYQSRKKVFIVNGKRTPIANFGQSLRSVNVEDLAGHAFLSAIEASGIEAGLIEGIYLGHGYQSPYAPNTARVAQLNYGLPADIPAATVQRQCGSGMEAIALAVNQILLNGAGFMLAGGAESLSTVPYLIPGSMRWKGVVARYLKMARLGPRPSFFHLADNGLAPLHMIKDMKTYYMGGTAQRLADTYKISREEADEYSLRSQALAGKAIADGFMAGEISPILVPGRGLFSVDEHPRKTSLEKLAGLKPALGTRDVTAGNSSGLNDAACALVLASEDMVRDYDLNVLSEIVDMVVVGVEPEQMGLGPVEAIKALLKRTGLSLSDIGRIEVNEAFAAQYLACEKLLGLNREIVNVNGGAIALGHPIGMTGARLPLTLSREMQRSDVEYGIASLCIGGGMGYAMLLRRTW